MAPPDARMVRRSVRYAWTAAVSLAAGGGIVTMSPKGMGNARRGVGEQAQSVRRGRGMGAESRGTGKGGFQTRPYGTTGGGRWDDGRRW